MVILRSDRQDVLVIPVVNSDGEELDKVCECPVCQYIAMSINLKKTAFYCIQCFSLFLPNRSNFEQ